MALNKADKKHLRRQAEDAAKAVVFRSFILSDHNDTLCWPKDLLRAINRNGVQVHCAAVADTPGAYRLSHPSNHAESVQAKMLRLSMSDIEALDDYDMLVDQSFSVREGETIIELSACIRQSPVIDLIWTTIIKALGPLTKGVLVHCNNQVVMGDWLAWSLDYMGDSIAAVSRVYNDDCPDFGALLREHPTLVYKRRWWSFRQP